MDYKLAIEIIKNNFPPVQHTQLTGALETAIKALEERIEEEENTPIVDVDFYELEEEYSQNE